MVSCPITSDISRVSDVLKLTVRELKLTWDNGRGEKLLVWQERSYTFGLDS